MSFSMELGWVEVLGCSGRYFACTFLLNFTLTNEGFFIYMRHTLSLGGLICLVSSSE